MLPTVQQTVSGNSATNLTTRNITMPSTVNRGDLLLAVLSSDGNTTHTMPAGWEQVGSTMLSASSTATQTVWGKMADGSEDSAAVAFGTAASEMTAWIVHRITGWIGTVADIKIGTAVTGTSTAPNAPSLNPADYATDDFLWIAIAGWDGNVAASAGVGGSWTHTTNRAANTNGCGVATNYLAANAASQDPGAITIGSEQWTANTIAIPGARVIFTEDFENGGSPPADGTAMDSSNTGFDLFNGVGTRTFESASPVPNRGQKSGRFITSGTGQALVKNTSTLPGGTNGGVAYKSLVLEAYFRTSDTFDIANRVMVIEESVSLGGDDIAVLRINASGELQFLDGTTARNSGAHVIPSHSHYHRIVMWVDQQRDYYEIRHWWGADKDSVDTGATNYEVVTGTNFTSALIMEVFGIGNYGGVTSTDGLAIDDFRVFAGVLADMPGPPISAVAEVASATGTAHQPTIVTAGGGTTVTPTCATGTGTAQQPTILRAGRPLAQVATATGTAQAPNKAVRASAGVATGTAATVTAQSRVATLTTLAAATGTAHQPTISVTAATTALAGVATGTGTAQQPTITRTGRPLAGVAAATGTAHAPDKSVRANAGVAAGTSATATAQGRVATLTTLASGTGTAHQPTISVATATTALAGVAAATGTAHDATTTRTGRPLAQAATATGTAHAPSALVHPNAGVAAGTGTAQQPLEQVRPNAGVAVATGTAHTPTTIRTGRALAQSASGVGTAQVPSPSVRVNAGAATATGAAQNATGDTDVVAVAGVAAATGAALDPTTVRTGRPLPSTATAAGAALTAQGNVRTNAGVAAAVGAALQPTITTLVVTTALAGVASGTGTAQNPTITRSSRPLAQAATAAAQALNAQGAVRATAGVAAATGTAQTPIEVVRPNAGAATATAQALDATVSATAATTATAGVAAGTGAALGPATSVRASSQAATATGTALQPIEVVRATAGVATGTATAHAPTIQRTGRPLPSVAAATGQALNPQAAVVANAGEAAAVGTAHTPATSVRAQARPANAHATSKVNLAPPLSMWTLAGAGASIDGDNVVTLLDEGNSVTALIYLGGHSTTVFFSMETFNELESTTEVWGDGFAGWIMSGFYYGQDGLPTTNSLGASSNGQARQNMAGLGAWGTPPVMGSFSTGPNVHWFRATFVKAAIYSGGGYVRYRNPVLSATNLAPSGSGWPPVGTSHNVSIRATAEAATAAALALDAIVQTANFTNAAAGCATGAGTGGQVQARITGTAGVATGAGAAQNPTILRAGRPLPTTAAASALALNAQGQVRATAGAAAATGTAHSASVSTSGATNAQAGVASGTGASLAAQARVAPSAAPATGTGAALQPTTSRTGVAPAGAATGTGVSNPVQARISPAAASSTGTGTAQAGQVRLLVSPGVAAGAGTAGNATVGTAGQTYAQAGCATGTGVANGPSILASSTALPSTATAAGTAQTPQARIQPPAGAGAGAGAANAPKAAVRATAQAAGATGTANAPSLATSTTVNAGCATASGQALQPTVSTSTDAVAAAGTAAATGAALGATTRVRPTTGLALAVSAAAQAAGILRATAGVATGTGQAYAPKPSIGARPDSALALATANTLKSQIAVTAQTAAAHVTAWPPNIVSQRLTLQVVVPSTAWRLLVDNFIDGPASPERRVVTATVTPTSLRRLVDASGDAVMYQDIELIEGDVLTVQFNLTYKDVNGVTQIFDLTGFSGLALRCKNTELDADGDAFFTGAGAIIGAPTLGVVEAILTADATDRAGRFAYALKGTKAGNPRTLAHGGWIISNV